MDAREAPAEGRERWQGALDGFSVPMQELLVSLLMYKSVLSSDWLRKLAAQERDPRLAEALVEIMNQSEAEAEGTLETARAWDPLSRPESLERLASLARRRFVEDLTVLKEGNVEVGLAMAMAAPTQELRAALVDLADVDRRHADALRAYLGSERVRDLLARRSAAMAGGGAFGAHDGRLPGRSLRDSVEGALGRLRSAGRAPTRVVLSSTAVRHLRDEGAIAPGEATLFGLPVDVEFGWEGECFAFVTGERVGLAEILTAEAQRGG